MSPVIEPQHLQVLRYDGGDGRDVIAITDRRNPADPVLEFDVAAAVRVAAELAVAAAESLDEAADAASLHRAVQG